MEMENNKKVKRAPRRSDTTIDDALALTLNDVNQQLSLAPPRFSPTKRCLAFLRLWSKCLVNSGNERQLSNSEVEQSQVCHDIRFCEPTNATMKECFQADMSWLTVEPSAYLELWTKFL